MGVGLVTATEKGGEAQMWDKAPGALSAESEVEEGREEGGVRSRTLARQASSAGFQAQKGADFIFPDSLFPPQQGKQGFQDPPILFFTLIPTKSPKSSPSEQDCSAQTRYRLT